LKRLKNIFARYV